MNRTLLIMLASVIAIVGMLFLLREPGPRSDQSEPLMLFCAASNRAVIEAIRTDYEEEYGREVQVQYGPSQNLLSSTEISEVGDLFLPADDSFLSMAREKDLIVEQIPIAKMHAGIAVEKGNPKGIRSLSDLLRSDVRFVQANPEAAAIGVITRKTLQATGQWEPLEKATIGFRTTVTEVANDLVIGAADAGIVYDAVLHTYPKLEFVRIPELDAAGATVAIGVIESTDQPSAALHFARYITARDRGLKRYQEHGFVVSGGDEWSDVPELSLFAGAMLRPAIDDTIKNFEQREGVQVNRVYNGCGILVGQMEAGQHPDAYFACDQEFMNQVQDLFASPVEVSENELVIIVQKGNPHGIADLKDLGREGLRVGIGHEKECAMGWVTQNTLKEGRIQKEVMDNVLVQSATGDMLVNQMLAGSLDAAIVYLSNAAGKGEKLDAIRIQGLSCSLAVQPFAVSKKTRYPQLSARLFSQLTSASSRDVFEAEGFRWKRKE